VKIALVIFDLLIWFVALINCFNLYLPPLDSVRINLIIDFEKKNRSLRVEREGRASQAN